MKEVKRERGRKKKFMVVERGGVASQVETEIHGEIMEVVRR